MQDGKCCALGDLLDPQSGVSIGQTNSGGDAAMPNVAQDIDGAISGGFVLPDKESGDMSCSGTPIIYSKVKDVQLNGTSIVDKDGIADIKATAITNEEIDDIWKK